jgi:hypothetical protein
VEIYSSRSALAPAAKKRWESSAYTASSALPHWRFRISSRDVFGGTNRTFTLLVRTP